jgi:hypothetical protein
MRSKIFSGQICRQIYEVRVVRKFGKSGGQEIWEVGGLGGRKDRNDPLFGKKYIL